MQRPGERCEECWELLVSHPSAAIRAALRDELARLPDPDDRLQHWRARLDAASPAAPGVGAAPARPAPGGDPPVLLVQVLEPASASGGLLVRVLGPPVVEGVTG